MTHEEFFQRWERHRAFLKESSCRWVTVKQNTHEAALVTGADVELSLVLGYLWNWKPVTVHSSCWYLSASSQSWTGGKLDGLQQLRGTELTTAWTEHASRDSDSVWTVSVDRGRRKLFSLVSNILHKVLCHQTQMELLSILISNISKIITHTLIKLSSENVQCLLQSYVFTCGTFCAVDFQWWLFQLYGSRFLMWQQLLDTFPGKEKHSPAPSGLFASICSRSPVIGSTIVLCVPALHFFLFLNQASHHFFYWSILRSHCWGGKYFLSCRRYCRRVRRWSSFQYYTMIHTQLILNSDQIWWPAVFYGSTPKLNETNSFSPSSTLLSFWCDSVWSFLPHLTLNNHSVSQLKLQHAQKSVVESN